MDGKSAILIDTGSEEKDSLLFLLESHQLTPTAIINTHLHIDHIGCNKLLQRSYECPAYCPIEEIKDARYDAGIVKPNIPKDNPCKLIPLPGHSIAHQGVVTPDGVCFVGDAIMSVPSKMPYYLNVGESIESMERICNLSYPYFVLSHAGVYERDAAHRIAEENIKKEHDRMDRIIALCNRKIKKEKLAALFMDSINISRENQDIFWVMDTALARIQELKQQGRIEIRNGYVHVIYDCIH